MDGGAFEVSMTVVGRPSYVMAGCYCFTMCAYLVDRSALSYLKSLALFFASKNSLQHYK